jgi:phosphoserine aminotransferase
MGDYLSNFLSGTFEELEQGKLGLLCAGAQKNCGIAGVTIAIGFFFFLSFFPSTPTLFFSQ